MATDDVAEFLADVRMQAEDHRLVPAHMVLPLLAVADKVLGAHREAGGRCAWCRNPDGKRALWPCGEYLAITAALTENDPAPAGAAREDGGP